jgi:hypothetical protein
MIWFNSIKQLHEFKKIVVISINQTDFEKGPVFEANACELWRIDTTLFHFKWKIHHYLGVDDTRPKNPLKSSDILADFFSNFN